jgi:hypothetical protein
MELEKTTSAAEDVGTPTAATRRNGGATSTTGTAEFVPEMRLLLACARKTLCPDDARRIVGLCHLPLDWPLFLRLVARHRVAPLVWQSLKSAGQASVPESIQADLRRGVEKNTLKALKQTADLVRLVRRFEDADIRVLPLKGPILAMQAYGALNLRHAGDLDLLVDPASVWDADRILKDAGYARTDPEYPLSPGQAAAFMKIRKDFSYARHESTIGVELHWRLSQNAHLLAIGLEELWPGREFVPFGSDRVAAMSRQELLLYLCAHGAHTGWFRLKWLCDIAELIGRDSGIDMAQLFARAQDFGVDRVLAQGLLLAHRMLGSPLPAALSAETGRDRAVQSLVRLSMRALEQDERYWSTDNTPVSFMPAQARYRLKLRANLRYKWHNFYFHSLWTDGCRRIRLPQRLFPLYLVLAPFLWIVSLLRRSVTEDSPD